MRKVRQNMTVQRPGKSLNMKWGEPGEEPGVISGARSSISLDTGAPPHSSKCLKGPRESTLVRLGPLVCVLPWKPQVMAVSRFPRPA